LNSIHDLVDALGKTIESNPRKCMMDLSMNMLLRVFNVASCADQYHMMPCTSPTSSRFKSALKALPPIVDGNVKSAPTAKRVHFAATDIFHFPSIQNDVYAREVGPNYSSTLCQSQDKAKQARKSASEREQIDEQIDELILRAKHQSRRIAAEIAFCAAIRGHAARMAQQHQSPEVTTTTHQECTVTEFETMIELPHSTVQSVRCEREGNVTLS
jgi:hypothetical protein